MLTKLTIKNFKSFLDVTMELGGRVVFVGPNNSGKTSALQALALWEAGVKKWLEKRKQEIPAKRPGVTINRRDLIAVPVPVTNLLWRNLKTHQSGGSKSQSKSGTKKVYIEILVEGVSNSKNWTFGLEFYYANEESLYCRPMRRGDDSLMELPPEVGVPSIAYLGPMSGLAAHETRLDPGAIQVRLGEGRTAEVLRNLCNQIYESEGGPAKWKGLTRQMETLFGIRLEDPNYIRERGEIELRFQNREGISLDLSSSGRGQQQTLLLLAHMTANPGAILLLDEPDAHLEILRQRQIYQILSDTSTKTGSQILAASHSEVVLNEAADRDIVIAFVGKPHRIDDRGSQVAKSLKEIGFEHFYQAEETGWVLYLEGSTDLAILQSFAVTLKHPASEALGQPFVHYVANQPSKARDHFYGLREAKKDLVGLAIFDHLEKNLPSEGVLQQVMWKKRELENYLCQKCTLLGYARAKGQEQSGKMGAQNWEKTMLQCIETLETALGALGKPSPWGPTIKVTDDFLDPLFTNFFQALGLPNLMRKTDYHTLAPFVPVSEVDNEIIEILNWIHQTAQSAKPELS